MGDVVLYAVLDNEKVLNVEIHDTLFYEWIMTTEVKKII